MASWFVECPAYAAGPFSSQAAAENAAAHVDQLGACMFDHTITERGAG